MATGSWWCKLCPSAAAVLVVAVLPATAFAQASRTWVSGVGDDANPCSRTAPCKTFAGAISKTAAGGAIDALDPGGFGAVTITKSITIDGTGTLASVLVSGTNGIVISAGPTDAVTIRNLDIEGIGAGLNGVRILSAGVIRLEGLRIYGFTGHGVDFEANNNAHLVVQDSSIYGNTGTGVFTGPPSGTANLRATLRHDTIDDNGCGIVAASFGAGFGFCGAADNGSSMPRATIDSFRTSISGNATGGVVSEGPNGLNRISADEISGNGLGLGVGLGGTIASFGNNAVVGNVSDGNPNGGTILLKKADIASAHLRALIRRAAHKHKHKHRAARRK